jgi:hypothetical protein
VLSEITKGGNMRRSTLALAALSVLVVAAAVSAALATAVPAPKVDVCHLGDEGYQLINISENALPAHRRHGDGLPGESVPGMPGMVFDSDCSIENAPLADYVVVTSPAMVFGDGGYGGWSCPASTVVIGGGFQATEPVAVSAPGTPGSVWPHYTFGPAESGWVVRDDPDGVGNTITVYAICAAKPAGYEVVSSTPLAFGDGGYGGWSCPAGTVVLGGGFNATDTVAVSAPGTPGSIWPHHTFGASESGWVVRDDPNSAGNTITVYAICALEPAGYDVVNSSALAFGDGGYGGWSCPAGTAVTGGGFDATDPVAVSAPGTPGSVWPHYTFGAAEYGWVVRDDPDGVGNTITVYAVCADFTT